MSTTPAPEGTPEPPAKVPYPPWTGVKIRKDTRIKLRGLRQVSGFRRYDSCINFLFQLAKDAVIPVANYSEMFGRLGTTPIVVTGLSGCGKTWTIKEEVLGQLTDSNIFLVGTSNEYPDLKKVNLGDFFSIRWKGKNQRIRFVPNSNPAICRAEVGAITSQLVTLMQSEYGILKPWVLIFEEAHRCGSDERLRFLILEARKTTKKVLVISSNVAPFAGLCPILRPPPGEEHSG